MKRNNILILLLLLLILALVLITCESINYNTYRFNYEYVTGEQYFSFEYPESWEIVEDEHSKSNELTDGAPDFGIRIYMDSDGKDTNFIDIFEGISPNMYRDDSYSKDEFLVDGIKKGDLYSLEEKDTVYKLIAFDKDDDNFAWRFVHIRAEKEFYDENKKKIEKVLNSIEF